MTYSVGDHVRFTKEHQARIKRLYSDLKKRKLPSYLDKELTVVRIEAEGWLIILTANGEIGEMGINKDCLERS